MKKSMVIIVALLVSSCAMGGGSMKCNDQAAKDSAKEIIMSKIDNYGWFKDMNVSVTDENVVDVETISKDEDLKKYSCGAKFSYRTNRGTGEAYFEYDISYLEDKGEAEVTVDFKKIIPSIMSTAMN